jgi:hypothetical protein
VQLACVHHKLAQLVQSNMDAMRVTTTVLLQPLALSLVREPAFQRRDGMGTELVCGHRIAHQLRKLCPIEHPIVVSVGMMGRIQQHFSLVHVKHAIDSTANATIIATIYACFSACPASATPPIYVLLKHQILSK